VITSNVRVYPPSEVPPAPEACWQEQSVKDLRLRWNTLMFRKRTWPGWPLGNFLTSQFVGVTTFSYL
jgi:hypothetical protein